MGLGAKLLDAAVVALHGLGYRRAELWVLEGNRRAQSFYRRHGCYLVEGARREAKIHGVPVTEVAYRRDLSATSTAGTTVNRLPPSGG